MKTPLTEPLLRTLGFTGPYPHGEYYLYDERFANKGGDCVIMCVAPPQTPANGWKKCWHTSWNPERCMWATPKRGVNHHARVRTLHGLQRQIQRSMNTPAIECLRAYAPTGSLGSLTTDNRATDNRQPTTDNR